MIVWIKEHPYLSGTLVLLLVVLFFLFRRGASQSTSGVTAGGQYIPSDAVQTAQLAAGVQSQQTQAASILQTNEINAALAAKELEAQTAVTVAGLQSHVQLQNIITSGEVAQGNTNAELTAALAATGAQVRIADMAYSSENYKAGVAGHVAEEQSANALESTRSTNAAAVQIAGIQGDVTKYGIDAATLTELARTAAGVTVAGYSLEGLENTNATALDIVKTQTSGAETINAQNQQTNQLAITTGGQVSIAGIQGQVDLAEYLATLKSNDFTAVVNSVGDLSKGQSRNERAAVLSNLVAPGTGAAIEAPITEQAGGNSFSSIVSSIFGGATKLVGATAP